MTIKSTDSSEEYDVDAPSGRPVRLRRSRKKATVRSRKTRRKAVSSPGGIHQRANRRMSW